MKKIAPWIEQADEAMKRAAQRAREIAERTNTPLHVMRDGKIVDLAPARRLREQVSSPKS